MKQQYYQYHTHQYTIFQLYLMYGDLDQTCYIFPVFWLRIYVYILWRNSLGVHFIMQTQEKRSMSGLSPHTSNIIRKMSFGASHSWGGYQGCIKGYTGCKGEQEGCSVLFLSSGNTDMYWYTYPHITYAQFVHCR